MPFSHGQAGGDPNRDSIPLMPFKLVQKLTQKSKPHTACHVSPEEGVGPAVVFTVFPLCHPAPLNSSTKPTACTDFAGLPSSAGCSDHPTRLATTGNSLETATSGSAITASACHSASSWSSCRSAYLLHFDSSTQQLEDTFYGA